MVSLDVTRFRLLSDLAAAVRQYKTGNTSRASISILPAIQPTSTPPRWPNRCRSKKSYLLNSSKEISSSCTCCRWLCSNARPDLSPRVMGPTGSGKSNVRSVLAEGVKPDLLSQFIRQLLAGRPEPQGLQSVTSKIKAVRIFNPRVYSPISSLVVVDTPGFDDTNRTDYETLNMVADWLRKS